jgi:Sec-independent protein secretion pathway component TatC
MSLLLETDKDNTVNSHVDEFSNRMTLVLVSSLIFTAIWMNWIDSILTQLLQIMQPCASDCLNLYDPARWSAVRWLSATILGILSSIPIFIYQSYSFAKSGLLPSEKKWFLYWIIGGSIGILSVMSITILWIVPRLFSFGHASNVAMGFTPMYDAPLMLQFAISLVWAQMLIVIAGLAMLVAGLTGNLNQKTADWWRLRVHGLLVMLLALSLPDVGGMVVFSIILISILSVELISLRWTSMIPKSINSGSHVYDLEGAKRNILIADCRCDGGCESLSFENTLGLNVSTYNGLCNSRKERLELLDKVRVDRVTDVFISGCNGEPLPHLFKSNCHSLSCDVRGLDLMQIQSYRTIPQNPLGLDAALAIASQNDPWLVEDLPFRLVEVLEKTSRLPKSIVLDSRAKDRRWGLQLDSDAAFIKVHGLQIDEIVNRLSTLDLDIKILN